MPSKYNTVVLILIIVIAIFFRLWQFDSIPPGLYQDEAMNGADAVASLESGKFEVFYQNNNGREGMIVWLDALAIKAFGTATAALRLFPALAGVLAVLGLYFLAKLLFSIEIALASSFFMAISFWAVNFSRIGFRAGLMLPFLIWSFYFLYRGFTQLNVKSQISNVVFAISGLLFGLGFYTYISYRFAPILIAAIFIPYLIKDGNKKLWTGFLIFAVIAFVVALPTGFYFLNNPDDFFGRSGQVAIWSAESPLKAAVLSVATTLGMFNVMGDLNWRHNFAGSPQLFWPIGILFLLGLGISVKHLGFREKFILAWFFIFLLPSILSTEGNPHALRALGAMPMAMIFAGIGLIWIYKKAQSYLDENLKNQKFTKYQVQILRIKKEVFILLIAFLFLAGFAEFNKYFVRWASNIRTIEAFSQNQVELANYFNSLSASVEKYIIWDANDRATDNGLPVSAQTIYFLTAGKTLLRQGFGGQAKINYLKSDELDRIKLGKNGTIIAPIYFDLDLLHNLNKQFPQSKINFIYINTAILAVP